MGNEASPPPFHFPPVFDEHERGSANGRLQLERGSRKTDTNTLFIHFSRK